MTVSLELEDDSHEVWRDKKSELLAYNTIQNLRREFSWIKKVRKATEEEDAAGIDLVVTLDVGVRPLQIKSSRTGKRKHLKKYGNKITVAIVDIDSRKLTRGRLLQALLIARGL